MEFEQISCGMKQVLDIHSLTDIKLLVDTFYDRVRNDELIGPVFNETIKDQWPVHLEKMYTFWQTVLLEEQTYFGAPFPPHMKLEISKEHFERWMKLFTETIDELFEGEKADEAKWRAEKMAALFISKIQYYKGRNSQPLI